MVILLHRVGGCVGGLIVDDLLCAGIVRKVFTADGAGPVGHVAGGQTGGRLGGDLRQRVVSQLAIGRSARVADRFFQTGRAAAGVSHASIDHGVGGGFGRRNNGLIPCAGEVLGRGGSFLRDGRRDGQLVVVHRLLIQHRGSVRRKERDLIGVDRMLCVEGHAVGGGNVAVARVADLFRQLRVAVPALKGAPGLFGGGQRYIAHGGPDRPEVGDAVIDRRQVGYRLLIRIDGAAVFRDRPAVEGGFRRSGSVARAALVVEADGIFFFESVLRQRLLRVKGEILICHLAGGGAVAVEMHLVGIGLPPGEQLFVRGGGVGIFSVADERGQRRLAVPAAELIAVPGGLGQRHA